MNFSKQSYRGDGLNSPLGSPSVQRVYNYSSYRKHTIYIIIITSLAWIFLDILASMFVIERQLVYLTFMKNMEGALQCKSSNEYASNYPSEPSAFYQNQSKSRNKFLQRFPPNGDSKNHPREYEDDHSVFKAEHIELLASLKENDPLNNSWDPQTRRPPKYRIIPKPQNLVRLGPGEKGSRISISAEADAIRKERFNENQFDVYVSDLIALDRTLPDTRLPGCADKRYPWNLPNTSIIIIYHNEAWSTLLRNIHSILNRTPPELLVEIILVDDCSDRHHFTEFPVYPIHKYILFLHLAHLGRPLDDYLKILNSEHEGKITLIRLEERSGLIRARLVGAEKAKGQTLTFLDAHCEVNVGWLEPLLAEIYENKKKVVAPIIDVIHATTFQYIGGSDLSLGGFDWSLNFRWYNVPKHEMLRRNNDRTSPLWSPAHAGGLFSIDREFFENLGAYDTGMDVWGAENIELSLRVWLCGGTLEIIPCSRVGHIFRKSSPYKFPGGAMNVIHKNQKRLVEVWFGEEWKRFYYRVNEFALEVDAGDVGERLAMKKQLGCHSIDWFIKNVYKTFHYPANISEFINIRAKETTKCLDTLKNHAGNIGMFGCNEGRFQIFFMDSMSGQIKHDDVCLQVVTSNDPTNIILSGCSETLTQQWIWDNGKIKSKWNTQLCISTRMEDGAVILDDCGRNHMEWEKIPVFN